MKNKLLKVSLVIFGLLGITVPAILFPIHSADAEPGLVAEYHFDGDTLDSSGNGNNGANYGATFVSGIKGQALSFDGIDDYVVVSENAGLNLDFITVEMWIKPTMDTSNDFGRHIIDKRLGSNDEEYTMYVRGQGDIDVYFGTSGEHAFFNGTAGLIPMGEWSHVIFTWDGNTLNLYRNGNRIGTVLGSGTIVSNSQSIKIGTRYDFSNFNFFKGIIDEVRIYNRALSAEEIKAHANQSGELIAPGTLTDMLEIGHHSNSQRKLARTSDGSLHVVYSRSDGARSQIYHSYSNNEGETWTEEPLTSETCGNQTNPTIAADSFDAIYVFWQGCSQNSPNHTQIRYKKYKTSWSETADITTDIDWDQRSPAIAVDSNDNIHSVWQKIDSFRGVWCGSGCGPLYHSKYDKSSNSWSAPNLIGAGTEYNEVSQVVAIDKDDNMHVAWNEGGLVNAATWHSAYKSFTASGELIEFKEFPAIYPYDNWITFPSIATDNEGNVHLIFTRDNRFNLSNSLTLTHIQKTAQGWSSPEDVFAPLPFTPHHPLYSTIAVDRDNNLHVVWQDDQTIKHSQYAGSWQAPETIIFDTDSVFPNLVWAWNPAINGERTNIPKTGYAFVWNDGPDVKFYKSGDLVWPNPPENPAFQLVLQGSIELSSLGSDRLTSIAFDPASGNLFVTVVAGSYFAEITASGTIVRTFSITDPNIPSLDNSGLSIDPTTGHIFFVNGLGIIKPEPIVEMTTNGEIINRFSSPVVEGTGLAIDPVNRHLFVADENGDLYVQGPQLVRELEQQGSAFVEVNSFELPTIFGHSDAGLEFNPFTGNLAVSGELGNNPGLIFDIGRDGVILGTFLDTGLPQGIAGITFDAANSKMYVLDGYNSKILVFAQAVSEPPENQPPILSFPRTGPYAGDGIDPNSGTAETRFTFRIIYTDSDDDKPSFVKRCTEKSIERGWVLVSCSSFSDFSDDPDYTQGVEMLQSHSIFLNNPGTYRYFFEASDGMTTARLPETGGLNLIISPPENQPPTCSIELRKNGEKIDKIDIGEPFDIVFTNYSADIAEVRFASDEIQDGTSSGSWTKDYGWATSSEDWDGSGKTKKWSFATAGDKEIWAEVKAGNGKINKCKADISAVPWNFAIITDLHIGRGYSDNDYQGRDLDYYLTERLKNVVKWINNNKTNYNIKFVVVLGDIADKDSNIEELRKGKDILETLDDNIPYIPVIGNHDIKLGGIVSGKKYENNFDNVFNLTDPKYSEKLKRNGINLEMQSIPDDLCEDDPDDLQNYNFNYKSIEFVVLDFVPRDKPLNPVTPWCSTNTFLWERLKLKESENSPVIILSHHPMTSNYQSWRKIGGPFNEDQIQVLKDIIEKSGVNASKIYNFAGHDHGFYENEKPLARPWSFICGAGWTEWRPGDHPCSNPRFMNANQVYPATTTPAGIPVITTEAVMVASNNPDSANSKGIIRLVKVKDDKTLNYDSIIGDTEFRALNPYFKKIEGSPMIDIDWGFRSKVKDRWWKIEFALYSFNKFYPLFYTLGFGDGSSTTTVANKWDNPIKVEHNYPKEAGTYSIEFVADKPAINTKENIKGEINIPNWEWGPFTLSPVDIIFTDPDGLTISKKTNEIFGATYFETDLDADGDLNDIVILSDRKIGDYLITVVPEPTASSTDTYSLEVLNEDNEVISLAKDVPISDIPRRPYLIKSTETGIKAVPIAIINGPISGEEGSPTIFDASGSYDPDGSIVLYEWDFEGDGVYDASSTTATTTHAWGDDWRGEAVLRVTDDEGLTNIATSSVVINNVAPVVAGLNVAGTIHPGQEIWAGDALNFSAAFSDPGWLDAHSAEWNFGDGATSTGLLPEENNPPDATGQVAASHIYPNKGVYTITLSVKDDDGGAATGTLTLEVKPIPAIVDFEPDALNLESEGKFITAYIELPEGYEASQIQISGLTLNGSVPALTKPTEIGDEDNDGIPDLMVKFDRTKVQAILAPAERAILTISGKLLQGGGLLDFEGSDVVKLIN